MKATIVGIQTLNFTPKEASTNPIVGIKIHLTHEDDNVSGFAVGTIFIKDTERNEDFAIGDEVNVYYGKSGKLKEIYCITPKPRKRETSGFPQISSITNDDKLNK